MSFVSQEIDPSEITETIECDVVVCGAGISGSTVAASAAQNGLKVVVLEKGSITGDVTMDGEKVGTLVAPTVDTEIERARKESER